MSCVGYSCCSFCLPLQKLKVELHFSKLLLFNGTNLLSFPSPSWWALRQERKLRHRCWWIPPATPRALVAPQRWNLAEKGAGFQVDGNGDFNDTSIFEKLVRSLSSVELFTCRAYLSTSEHQNTKQNDQSRSVAALHVTKSRVRTVSMWRWWPPAERFQASHASAEQRFGSGKWAIFAFQAPGQVKTLPCGCFAMFENPRLQHKDGGSTAFLL